MVAYSALSSTETVLAEFATIRSALPSPLRSSAAAATGPLPVAKACCGSKLATAAPGAVVFSSTETVLSLILVTIRSSLPSQSMSAVVTEAGPIPVSKVC